MARRLQFILLGLLAGATFWRLTEIDWDWRSGDAFLATFVLALCFFGGLLAMLGALSLGRALAGAAAIAVPAAALTALKLTEFTGPGQMLATGHVAVALTALATIPAPFAIALFREGRAGWRDYAMLFSEAWNIVVRYAAAWMFVGVVWLALWLLWSLLALVGIEAPRRFLTQPLAAWLVSGAAMGLGLAVVTELSDMISADLLLRLLRLLTPLVLAVEAVFVAVLPASGLSRLFGYLSPTAVLLATAAASILLVTIVVDRDDENAARAPAITWSARGLALLLPALALLSAWSLALRVAEHGWTPGRVGAAAAIALTLGYAGAYFAAALSGARWRAGVRRANVALALATVALGVLWMTPILSAERIAAGSQLARFQAGRAAAADLPLRQMRDDWGVAGVQALTALRAQAGAQGAGAQNADPALGLALAALDGAAGGQSAPRASAVELLAATQVLPVGAQVPAALLATLSDLLEADAAARCRAATAPGKPGCALAIGAPDPGATGRDAVFLRAWGGTPVLALRERANGGWTLRPAATLGTGAADGAGAARTAREMIDGLVASGGATAPARLRAFDAGDGRQIVVLP